MRTPTVLLALLAGHTLFAQSISTVGNSFQPALLTVQVGTDITLSIGGGHTMTEVNEATWNANSSTSNGGFNFSAGNHVLNLTVPGTYYYVCQPHSSMGMKGRIVVESGTGLEEAGEEGTLRIVPNPASEGILVTIPVRNGMVLRLIDVQGREVLRQRLSGSDLISVAHLAKGTYTALVEDPRGEPVARRPLTITR